MIFPERKKQCDACPMLCICRYAETYYQSKGEWPRRVPPNIVRWVNGNSECALAPYSILQKG